MSNNLWSSLKDISSHFFSFKSETQESTLLPEMSEKQEENNVPKRNNDFKFTDQDLEFLFNQLLEGVVNGWQSHRILQFFEKLEYRVTIDEWLEWLKRFETNMMSSYGNNERLASKMIIFGEITKSLSLIKPIADLAYSIGEKLLNGNEINSLIEFPETNVLINLDTNDEYEEEDLLFDPPQESFRNVIKRIQKDANFAQIMADELGLESSQPDFVVEKLLEKEKREFFNAQNSQDTSLTEEFNSDELENLFQLGLKKAKKGDLEGAILDWDEIVKKDPTFAQAWHNRGTALAYLNRLEEAIASFDKAIDLNVNDYKSWNDRGNALYNLNRWQEALMSLDRVVTINRNHPYAWYDRGLALEKLNLKTEALQSYEKALEINPDFKLAKKRQNQLLNSKNK